MSGNQVSEPFYAQPSHFYTLQKGLTRSSLAYAELFTVFAYIFHKFNLEVVGTTDWDMEWKDCYVPATYGHLKVAVSERKPLSNAA